MQGATEKENDSIQNRSFQESLRAFTFSGGSSNTKDSGRLSRAEELSVVTATSLSFIKSPEKPTSVKTNFLFSDSYCFLNI